MRELKSSGWIVAKGLMFALLAIMSAVLLLVEAPHLRVMALLGILVWSSCRFYYFLFYVLEKYVDPSLRYAGLTALAAAAWRRRQIVGGVRVAARHN